jgi:catechol 2,3-dioxygenase-like lactoylglutathione lyase family enzyme
MLESLSHIALVVRDPAKTAALFKDLFGARAIRTQ